jgi:outer membrane immunogenic protein
MLFTGDGAHLAQSGADQKRRMTMKTRWLMGAAAAALTVAGALSAQAADLPTRKEAPVPVFVPPPFTWTGFYIGGNAGGVWNTGNTTVNAFLPALVSPFFPGGVVLSNFFPSGRLNSENSGFIGGGQAGYNWQTGAFGFSNLVLGIETDFDGSSLSKNVNIVGANFINPFTGAPNDFFTAHGHASLDWLGSTRGRVGFAAWDNRLLIYGTGGVAYGGGSANASFFDAQNGFFWGGSINKSRVGWTVGGGVEYALTYNWIIGAEYLYFNLGSHTTTLVGTGLLNPSIPAGSFVSVKQTFEGSVARARISYKF